MSPLWQVDRQCPNRVVKRPKQLITLFLGLKAEKMDILTRHNIYPKLHEHSIWTCLPSKCGHLAPSTFGLDNLVVTAYHKR
jgi:hypothetical protein